MIQTVLASLDVGPDRLPAIVDRFLHMGGVDTQELTPQMVFDGLAENPKANWDELVWGCQESAGMFCLDDPHRYQAEDLPVAVLIFILLSHARLHATRFIFDGGMLRMLGCIADDLDRDVLTSLLRFMISRLEAGAVADGRPS